MQAVRANPELKVYVSDLLALVREGQSWDPELARGMRKYAGVWRSIFAHAEKRTSPAPISFVWTPAHLSVEQAYERGCDLVAWVGNSWADYFAKLASARSMIARGVCEAIEGELQYHKTTLDYVSWAAARVARLRRWTDIPPPPARFRHPPAPRLTLHEHSFFMDSRSGEVRCARCFAGARTSSTLAHLCNGAQRACKPTHVAAWKAEQWLLEAGPHAQAIQAEAVGVALAAAASSSAPPEPPAAAAAAPPPPLPQGAGAAVLQEFTDRGHRMAQIGPICICTVCAGFHILPRGVPRLLLDVCHGASKNPSTRDKQLRKLEKARQGLHPSTGASLG